MSHLLLSVCRDSLHFPVCQTSWLIRSRSSLLSLGFLTLVNLNLCPLINKSEKVKVLVAQPCLTLCNSRLYPARLFCPWNSPGKNTGEGSHSLLLGIFPMQRSNPYLLHCKQILNHLSQQGASVIFVAIRPFPVLLCPLSIFSETTEY